MFFKIEADRAKVGGVQMVNGKISFQGIALNVHCFSADGLLIDTGAKALAKHFTPFLNEQKIEQIVITHHHEDHTGNAAFLQKERKLPILMHAQKIADCSEKADYPLYRKLFWGRRAPFQAEPLTDQLYSSNAKWEVIETPGHAADHICLLNTETGQLFSGDLYVSDRFKVMLRDESMPQLIQSIEKVLTYNFGEMFCCHAGYVKDGRSALQRKLDYMLELQSQIAELHRSGLAPKQIQRALFPKTYAVTRFSRGEWDSLHIITSCLTS